MCGLVGVRTDSEAAELAASLLLRLQHRGQDGAGVTVLSENTGEFAGKPGTSTNFQTARGLGLIDVALRDLPSLDPGRVAIAHTRYATTGTGGVGELQPFVRGSPRVALAHNGNIVNTEELTRKFALNLETASDLDVLSQVFLMHAEESFERAVQTIFDEFNGSYAVVGMEQDGTLFGFRDPFGIRPLFFASAPGFGAPGLGAPNGATGATGSTGSGPLHVFASETCALAPLGDSRAGPYGPLTTQEVRPGEWIRIDPQGQVTRGQLVSKRNPQTRKRFCMFESVYFSSPQSEISNRSVYRLRFRLGQQLAQEIRETWPAYSDARAHFDFVVPVPDTSRSAALAVAETLSIPYREFLVKNNYVPRTFILGKQDQRLRALNNKLSLIGPEIRDFRILLVDDSVVRGNTSRMMAARLREAGAKSVTLASTCPPIRHGCYYGIDFPDPAELVAAEADLAQIARALDVDGLHYITVAGLKKALESEDLCTACLTGEYPTFDGSFEEFLAARRRQRLPAGSVRA